MNKITVKNPSEEELISLQINNWASWHCEISRFNWEYSEEEVCYFLEGEVIVETETESVKIQSGNLVIFPKGLKCIWNVKIPVKKVYKFNC